MAHEFLGDFSMRKGRSKPLALRPDEQGAQDCLWAVEELRNQEEQYRVLVETMNEGVVVRDVSGVITYVNERFCTLTGYSRDELIGRPAEGFLDEENRKTLGNQIVRRRRGEQENYELTLTGKGGRKIPTIVSPKPIFDSQGRFNGSFAAVTDITLLKRAEGELRESEKKLRLLRPTCSGCRRKRETAFPVSFMTNLARI